MRSSPRNVAALLIAVAALIAVPVAMTTTGDPPSRTATAAGAPSLDWPRFGRVPERTHYLPTQDASLDPPLREAWSVNTHALIEFPPAIADGVAYIVNKYGNASAIRLEDRKVLWRHDTHPNPHGPPTDVTGPAHHDGRVYFAGLDGDLVAVDAADGSVEWTRDLGAHLESSPLAVGKTVYIGTDAAELVGLDNENGSVRWRFPAGGAVKASPSFHAGRVYFANYQGVMFALDADGGRQIWRTDTTRVPPYGDGGFFSSPAIAFGNVYAARDDGTVFAFDAEDGSVRWSFPAGAAIYGSPAAAAVPGTPPTIYIGAENGQLYALDAADGKLRWRHDVGGPIPGTASVIGNTVYSSSFETGKSVGIDVHTKKRVFELDSAGYTPVVSDGAHLYLVGYFTLIGLEPSR